jgi:transposase-like protein
MRAIEAGLTKEQKWAELIRRQEQSKLSVSAFCREHGISDQSLYNCERSNEALLK